jgi:fructose-1-phosphate kinase PfkB-like protein
MDVITLTGNLLAEWTFDIGELCHGKTHRSEKMSFQVGGKGINVSRILERLGIESEAVSFAGGAMGDLCSKWLDKRNERHRFFPLDEGARPGVVIRESDNESSETTFLGKDLPVSRESWQAACAYISRECPKWLAITGSIPGWQSDWIDDLGTVLTQDSNIRVCADTYGPALADLIRLPLNLVKINRVELSKLVPASEESSLTDVLKLLRQTSPVQNWIITDGPRKLVAELAGEDIYEITPASIKEVSPTGSGDTFLAALLDGWIRDLDCEQMLAHATACATANAARPGLGDFPIPVPGIYRPQIRTL